MYLLTDDAAIETLVARRQAGCDVRVILEPHPYQADGANQGAYDRLATAGVDVRWASARFNYTHAKVAVVDGERLVVMTLNLTRAGLGGNREYVVLDEAAADVAAAGAVIAADLTGAATPSATAGGGSGSGGTGAGDVAGATRVVTSPEAGGSRAALTALISNAAHFLAVEMEELSDAAAVQALADAAGRGVAVDVVIPASGRSAATTAAAGRLAAAGARVRALPSPVVHAKAVVADGRRLYVGSANLTAGSLDANRELGVVLDDEAAAHAVAGTIAGDLARGVAP